MKTTEERIAIVQQRSGRMCRKRDRRVTAILSTASAVVGAFLVGLIGVLGAGTGGNFIVVGAYGSSMIFDNAGAYVIAAVCAFVVGSHVTAVLVQHRRNQRKKLLAEESIQTD